MINPTARDIVRIVRTYAYQNGLSLTDFAERADVSKSWISRLQYEDADVTLSVAERLLNTAGYKLVVKHQSQLTDTDTSPIKTLTDRELRDLRYRRRDGG